MKAALGPEARAQPEQWTVIGKLGYLIKCVPPLNLEFGGGIGINPGGVDGKKAGRRL